MNTHCETKTEGSQANEGQQPSATSETNDTFQTSTTGLPPSTATNGGSTFSFSSFQQPRTPGEANGIASSSGWTFGTTSGASSESSFGKGGTRRETSCFQRVGSDVVAGSGLPARSQTSSGQISNSSGSNPSGSFSFGSPQNDGSSTSDWRAPHGLHEPPPLGHII